MKLSDVIKVESRKRGKVTEYVAEFAGETWQASTRDEAVRGLVERLRKQVEHSDQTTTRTSPDGTVWILRYVFGWQYELHGAGRQHPSACLMPSRNYCEALEAMLRHKDHYDADCRMLNQCDRCSQVTHAVEIMRNPWTGGIHHILCEDCVTSQEEPRR